MRALALIVVAACGSQAHEQPAPAVAPVAREARLPRTPGAMSPSLVAINGVASGDQLADVDSCATCHPDVAAQWNSSAHSFASFGNPIYRYVVERVRSELGPEASRHCGGCHDMPLMVDGLMTSHEPIPSADLRAHSGVTCRLCHGIESTTNDGNGSYVLSAAPIDAPDLHDPASIARHKQQVAPKLGTELCVGCHRGFLSPDMGMPAHVSGIDEPGMWRASPYTGNGMARVDQVDKKTCIDCHMASEPASSDEYGAKQGRVASHRFVGGHTWMASMRGDAEQLRRTQANLEGVASIDIEPWAPNAVDVVIRNLLVGHRFPGGVLDMQDTWIEVELFDAHGRRLASSGLQHEKNPDDTEAHVLRTLMVDDKGRVLDEHEMAHFRSPVATQTLAPREAQAIRYEFTAGAGPLRVTARLRHRSRPLKSQLAACAAAHTLAGSQFLAGARGARDVTLDPCKPQPITLIAQTTRVLDGTPSTWQQQYEHGMALASVIVTRQDEARRTLEAALAAAPDDRARAMTEVQLGWVDAKQGKAESALARVERARKLLGGSPPVLDALLADANLRLNRYADAREPARRCTQSAPQNTAAWAVYARILVALGDHEAALAAATQGLALSPRDPDLLRSQATALAALHDPRAAEAEAAFTRFRTPDTAATLRIACAKQDARCARERNPVPTLALR